MSIRPSSALALALWLVFAVGTGVGIYFDVANETAYDLAQAAPILLSFAAFATVGLVIAARRPNNAIGWIFLAIGGLTGMGGLSGAYAGQTLPPSEPVPPLTLFAAWIQLWFWYPLISLATLFTLLLFPSGLPSRRWRPVLWVSILDVCAVSAIAAVSPTLDVGGRRVPNPIGLSWTSVPDIERAPIGDVFFFILVAALFGAVISLILRFRRSHGEERQQIKWFTYAAILLGVHFVALTMYPPYDVSVAGNVVLGIALTLLPLSVGIAILRYRLYAIDLIINRTLVYGTLTVLLAAVYFAGVATLQSSLRAVTGQGSALAIVLSTLAIAAAFNPLRRRIQAFIDQRFYRRKYDAQRALAAFGTTARDEVELERLAQALVGAVDETMRPAQVSLWIREPE